MKTTSRLLLIDVSHHYYGAFADWAAEQGVEVVVCDRQTVAGYSHETVLCVYQSVQGKTSSTARGISSAKLARCLW